jgi:oligogalacturonide transporter
MRMRLGFGRKIGYALGNLSSNTVLSALVLIYTSYFLIEIAGLRPALAGLIPLLGRIVDAVTDPLMGRLSDAVRIRGERRRPWFLIGALPLLLSFAMMWVVPAFASQTALFAYYAFAYALLSVALTVVVIPYLALVPEMALEYDERTTLQTYMNAASIIGIGVAIAMRPMAASLDAGPRGYAIAGVIMAVIVTVPWLVVHAVSFERPAYAMRPVRMGVVEGIADAMRQPTFRQLTLFYLCGRVAIDLVGAVLVLYFTHWLSRSADFEVAMLLFLFGVVASLPVWLRYARGRDKVHVFMIGSCWWIAAQFLLFAAQPDWPRWLLLVFIPILAFGYAVVDLMPWAMLGDVIDEDDLATGERREGVYNGVFTFVRKLAGGLAVFLALAMLDWAGLSAGESQTEAARSAVRWMASLGPVVFLVLGVWWARGYPLSRARHESIVAEIARRDA